MKRPIVLIMVAVLAVAGLGVYAWSGFGGSREYGLAEFNVQKLTCGSCVKNIQNALADVRGVGNVEVSVTSGRAKVEFDESSTDAETISGKIASAGYPAQVSRTFSADDYRALRENASRLAKNYVAKIDDRLISRDDFEKACAARRSPNATAAMEQGVRKAVWQETLQRELLLLAAEKNSIVVQDGEVALEIDKMRGGMQNFDAMIVKRFGSMENFAARVKEDMIINRNIEEHVLQGETDPKLRQFKLNNWYAELSAKTPVEIFDPALNAAAAGGGCGGSCCG